MKFNVEKSAFLKSLSHCQSIVEKKTTVPILNHVLISCHDNTMSLTTTDMEMALIERIPASIDENFSFAAPAHLLCDIVKKLPDNAVINGIYNAENASFEMKVDRSHFNLSCLDSRDFPQLTQEPLNHYFKITAEDFKKLLDYSRYAMSVEETRYFLNGVYLHYMEEENVLRCVATDGHRLASIDMPTPPGAENIPGIIISRKTIQEILKILDDLDKEEIQVGLSKTRIEVSSSNAVLTSQLLEGDFPNYHAVVPSNQPFRAKINPKKLTEVVDRVATIALDKNAGKLKVVKLTFTKNCLTVSAISQELGRAVEDLEIDYPQGENLEIGYNAKYLIDILEHLDSEQASITFENADNATVVNSVGSHKNIFSVLMPIRV